MFHVFFKGNWWKDNMVCAELDKMRVEKLTCQDRKPQQETVYNA